MNNPTRRTFSDNCNLSVNIFKQLSAKHNNSTTLNILSYIKSFYLNVEFFCRVPESHIPYEQS